MDLGKKEIPVRLDGYDRSGGPFLEEGMVAWQEFGGEELQKVTKTQDFNAPMMKGGGTADHQNGTSAMRGIIE